MARLGEKILWKGQVGLQQSSHEPVVRLCRLDDVGAGDEVAVGPRRTLAIAHPGQAGLGGEAADLDAVAPKQSHQLGDQLGVALWLDQIANESRLAVVDRGSQAGVVVAQQFLAVAGGGANGGERRRVLLLEGVGEQADRLVGPLHGQPTRRALLVEHADGALVAAPGGRVAGIEEVVALARHVLEAGAVERLGVGLTEADEPATCEVGEEGAVGLVGRIEVELDVGSPSRAGR